jgi:uncharacterized protein
VRNPERADTDPTVLTEMQIGMAIRRSIIRTIPIALNDNFPFHARTPARKEIDFMAHQLAGTAIEGKYVEDVAGTPRPPQRTLPNGTACGVLVTSTSTAVRDYERETRANTLPSALCADRHVGLQLTSGSIEPFTQKSTRICDA